MAADDIYGRRDPPAPSRRKRSATSQRRDAYLRGRGEEPVHHHRHHHESSHRSYGWRAPLFSLGMLALLIAVALWWRLSGR